MKFSLQKRIAQARDYSAHKSLGIGAQSVFPAELLFLSPVINQGETDKCTAYGGVSCRINEVAPGTVMDPEKFWDQELSFSGVSTSTGFDIQVPAACACKLGFPDYKPTAYFWVTPNNGLDLFDACRTVMLAQNRPLLGGLTWMQEYTLASNAIISSIGKNVDGGHSIKISGWKTINGLPYIVLQQSWGTGYGDNGLFYMPRDVFNKAFVGYGIFYWSDDPNAKIVQLGFFQTILQNLISLYQTLISEKTGYPPAVSLLPALAQGIFEAEGNGSQAGIKYNNRGDIRGRSGNKYIAGLGATGYGENNLAIFPDMETGDKACLQLVTDVANNLMLAYPKPCSISQFAKIYADPQTQAEWDDYVAILCKHTGKVATNTLTQLL